MEKITVDSQLMKQSVAAQAFPSSAQFTAARDAAGKLLLFSKGTNSKMYVSMIDKGSDQRCLQDLGTMLQLPGTYQTQAFGITQDPASSTLYVAMAISRTADSSKSELCLLQPFKPQDRDLSSGTTKLDDLIIPETNAKTNRVHSIFMANAGDGLNYPPVIFSYQTTIHKSTDLASAVVEKKENKLTWKRTDKVALPENASSIQALQPVRLKSDDLDLPGFATLYTQKTAEDPPKEEQKIVFRDLGKDRSWSITCPAGTKALSSVVAADGYNDLLIGGTGLHRLKSDLSEGTNPELILNAGSFSAIKHLRVAQNGANVTVWATNSVDGVGYVKANQDFTQKKAEVQVIPDGQGGTFTPFKATARETEKFVVSSSTGQLSLLEQDSHSDIWGSVPLVTPKLDQVTEFQGYVTQLRPVNSSGGLLPGEKVTLRSSGDASVIINGRPLLVPPSGVDVLTDDAGLVTMTVPTQDLSSQTFSVSRKTVAGTLTDQVKHAVDPAHAVHQSLAGIKDKDTLKQKAGSHIRPGLTDPELEEVGKAIGEAFKLRTKILEGRSIPDTHLEYIEPLLNWKKMFWSAWHWVERQANKVKEVFVEAGHLCIKIGGQALKWALNTVTQVGKAISLLLNKVVDLAKDAIKWLGFLFDWTDIKNTKDTIVNITNDALKTGKNKLEKIREKETLWHQEVEKALKGAPKETDLNNANATANDANANKNTSHSAPTRSVQANWVMYQLQHGGAASVSVIHEMDESDYYIQESLKPWETELMSIRQTLGDQVEPAGSTVVSKFTENSKREITGKDAYQSSKPKANPIVAALKKLVGLLIAKTTGLVENCLDGLQKIINKPITIPVISELYYRATKERLTVLQALALIIAIPATVISKLIFGTAPKQYASGQFAAMLENLKFPGTNTVETSETPSLAFNKAANIIGMAVRGIGLIIDPPELVMSDSSDKTVPYQPLIDEATLLAAQKGNFYTDFKFYRAFGGLIYNCFQVPLSEERPAHTIRVISWIVALAGNTVDVALIVVSSIEKEIARAVRAIMKLAIGIVIYALEVTVRVKEIQTKAWKGKDDAQSYTDIASLTFTLVKTGAKSGEIIFKNPKVKAACIVVKKVTNLSSQIMDNTISVINMKNNKYNPLPFLAEL